MNKCVTDQPTDQPTDGLTQRSIEGTRLEMENGENENDKHRKTDKMKINAFFS